MPVFKTDLSRLAQIARDREAELQQQQQADEQIIGVQPQDMLNVPSTNQIYEPFTYGELGRDVASSIGAQVKSIGYRAIMPSIDEDFTQTSPMERKVMKLDRTTEEFVKRYSQPDVPRAIQILANEVVPNLGYSLGMMGATAPGAVAGGVAGSVLGGVLGGPAGAVAGKIVGSTIGGLATGVPGGLKVVGRQKMDEIVDSIKQRVEPQIGRKLNDTELKNIIAYGDYVNAAKGTANWEVYPEVAGDLLAFGIGSFVFSSKIAQSLVGKVASKGVGKVLTTGAPGVATKGALTMLGTQLTEQGTELPTNYNQSKIDYEIGLRDTPPTWTGTFKEQFRPVALTTMIMGGTIGGAGALHGALTKKQDNQTNMLEDEKAVDVAKQTVTKEMETKLKVENIYSKTVDTLLDTRDLAAVEDILKHTTDTEHKVGIQRAIDEYKALVESGRLFPDEIAMAEQRGIAPQEKRIERAYLYDYLTEDELKSIPQEEVNKLYEQRRTQDEIDRNDAVKKNVADYDLLKQDLQVREQESKAQSHKFENDYKKLGKGHRKAIKLFDAMIKDGTMLPVHREIFMELTKDMSDKHLESLDIQSNANLDVPGSGKTTLGRFTMVENKETGEVTPTIFIRKALAKEYANRLIEKIPLLKDDVDKTSATAEAMSTFAHELGHFGRIVILPEVDAVNISNIYDSIGKENLKTYLLERFKNLGFDPKQLDSVADHFSKNFDEMFSFQFADYTLNNIVSDQRMVPFFERILLKLKEWLTIAKRDKTPISSELKQLEPYFNQILSEGAMDAVEAMKQKYLGGDVGTVLGKIHAFSPSVTIGNIINEYVASGKTSELLGQLDAKERSELNRRLGKAVVRDAKNIKEGGTREEFPNQQISRKNNGAGFTYTIKTPWGTVTYRTRSGRFNIEPDTGLETKEEVQVKVEAEEKAKAEAEAAKQQAEKAKQEEEAKAKKAEEKAKAVEKTKPAPKKKLEPIKKAESKPVKKIEKKVAKQPESKTKQPESQPESKKKIEPKTKPVKTEPKVEPVKTEPVKPKVQPVAKSEREKIIKELRDNPISVANTLIEGPVASMLDIYGGAPEKYGGTIQKSWLNTFRVGLSKWVDKNGGTRIGSPKTGYQYTLTRPYGTLHYNDKTGVWSIDFLPGLIKKQSKDNVVNVVHDGIDNNMSMETIESNNKFDDVGNPIAPVANASPTMDQHTAFDALEKLRQLALGEMEKPKAEQDPVIMDEYDTINEYESAYKDVMDEVADWAKSFFNRSDYVDDNRPQETWKAAWFGSPEITYRDEASRYMYLAAQRYPEDKTEIYNYIIGKESGSKTGEQHPDTLTLMRKFKKNNGKLYQRLNQLLINADVNGLNIGYSYQLLDENGKVVGQAETRAEAKEAVASAKNKAVDYERYVDEDKLKKNGLATKEERDLWEKIRTMADMDLQRKIMTLQQIIDSNENRGKKTPKYTVVDAKGRVVEIDLHKLVNMMGDLKEWYFPRQRKFSKYMVIAKNVDKDGNNLTQPFMQFYRSKIEAQKAVNTIKRKGASINGKRIKYKDVHWERSRQNPENMIGVYGKISSIEAAISSAVEHMSKAIDRPMYKKLSEVPDIKFISDYEYTFKKDWKEQGKKAGDKEKHFVIYTHGNPWYGALMSMPVKEFSKRYYDADEEAIHFVNPTGKFEDAVVDMMNNDQTHIEDVRDEFVASLAIHVADMIKSSSGLRSSMIRRKDEIGNNVWAGYEEDLVKSFTEMAQKTSSGVAKSQMARDMMDALNGTYNISLQNFETNKERREWIQKHRIDPSTQTEMYNHRLTYIKHMLKPQDFVDSMVGTVKIIGAIRYLGGFVFNIGAPFVNLTSFITTVPPSMSHLLNMPLSSVPTYVARGIDAYRAYKFSKNPDLSPGVKRLIDFIILKGQHEPQFQRESLSPLKGKLGRGTDKFMEYMMLGFGTSESVLRVSTIVGSYMYLEEQAQQGKLTADVFDDIIKKSNLYPGGKFDEVLNINNPRHMSTLFEIAKNVSDRAHGVYTKASKPLIVQKFRPADIMLMYTKFPHTVLMNMYEYGFKEKDAKNFLYLMFAPMLVAGMAANPLYVGIKAVLNPVLKKLFDSDNPEEDFYEWLEQVSPLMSTGFRQGTMGMAGVDISGSLGIEIPSLQNSVPVAFAKDFAFIAEAMMEGQWGLVAEKAPIMPRFASQVMKALREHEQGIVNPRGTPVFYEDEQIRPTDAEAITQSLGLRPARIARLREKEYEARRLEAEYTKRRSRVSSMFKRFFELPPEKQSREKLERILADVADYNDDVIRRNVRVPLITGDSLRKNVIRAFTPPKRERLRKQANEK
jgi:hypothetical protein